MSVTPGNSDTDRQDYRERPCDAPGCTCEGLYRAPKDRACSAGYYWFCLEHVRAYNLDWDFCKGMSESDIERARRHDAVWQRPSWPLAGRRIDPRLDERLDDPFDLFSGRASRSRTRPRAKDKRQKALDVLGLDHDVSFEAVKARYKYLAKKLHPDANGADRHAEERLKRVNEAYATLRSVYAG